MPMADALLIAAIVVAAAAALSDALPRLRPLLRSWRTWLLASAGGAAASAASAVVARSRHAGTGTSEDRGWPKPFRFEWTSFEGPDKSEGFSVLYFAGNAAVWAAAVLALLSVLRLARR